MTTAPTSIKKRTENDASHDTRTELDPCNCSGPSRLGDVAVTQVLVPAAAYPRVATALAALEHDVEPLLWTADGVSDPDGNPVGEYAPAAAWVSVDLFFTGDLVAYTDAVAELGTVRWAQAPLAGVDAPPFQKILQSGIRLSNSDAPNIGVAEYVMSALLSHRHGIAGRIERHGNRVWEQQPWPEIGGQRWLVVGFGSIGREIAKRARPFGVQVVGLRRTAVDDPAADRMATMDDLGHELGEADVVILACPLTEETRGLVDAEFLDAMRADAVLVNVSRGAVVNDDALLAALDDAVIDAAILDVFDPEPLPDNSPLWTHPRITITSHIAGAGAGFVARNDDLFIEQLDDFLSERPLRLEVR